MADPDTLRNRLPAPGSVHRAHTSRLSPRGSAVDFIPGYRSEATAIEAKPSVPAAASAPSA